MKKRENILKDAPDYEPYSENEVILSIEEMRELGLLKCGGCCNKGEGGCGGCSKGKSCNGKCCGSK